MLTGWRLPPLACPSSQSWPSSQNSSPTDNARRTRRRQQRAQLQSELVSVGEEATALAQKRSTISLTTPTNGSATPPPTKLSSRDGLRHLVDELRNHITSGEALLSGLRDGFDHAAHPACWSGWDDRI